MTHPDGHYMYSPVQPRYTPVMSHRPQRQDSGSMQSSPIVNLNVMGSGHVGYMYPQQQQQEQRESSINYRSQPPQQVDSRYQPQLYNPPAYSSSPMNAPVPYGYRNLSSSTSHGSTSGPPHPPTPADDDVGIDNNNQQHQRDTSN